MTEEEQKALERQAAKDFPVMDKAFTEVRDGLVEAMFATGLGKADERERIYRAVQTLDAVKAVVGRYMASGATEIAAYIKELAEAEEEKPTT